MTNYKQTDERWANDTYYNGYKFKDYFCFGTSLGNLVDLTPPETAQRLRDAGAFDSEGRLNSEKAAQALALDYRGKSDSFADDCDYAICETHYFAPKAPQHFFIKFKDGRQLDPLGKNINYPIVSYRLFINKKGENMFSDEEVWPMFEAVRKDFLGQNPTSDDINADMNAAKNRQKDSRWALSEFVHDRKKELKPKDCSSETTPLNKSIDILTKDLNQSQANGIKIQKSLNETTVALQTANATIETLNKKIEAIVDKTNIVEAKKSMLEWYADFFEKE